MRGPKSFRNTNANYGTLFALALCVLLPALTTSIANIALPTFSKEFSAPFHQIQWINIAYLVTMTLGAVFAGHLGDIFGHRQILLIGLVIYCTASALGGIVYGLWMVIAARGLQGIGAAFLVTLAIAMVRETAKDAKIGRTMGVLGSMGAIGTALGPSLGGFLIATAGWRSIFLVLFTMGILTIWLVLSYLPRSEPDGKSQFMQFTALRNGKFVSSLFASLLVATVMMSTLLVGPFYLGFALGLHEGVVGLIMSIGPVISICSGLPSGQIVDKLGARSILIWGLILMGLGAISLSLLPLFFGLVGYILAIIILTPGYQLFQAANNTMVMVNVTANQRGTISGLLTLARNIGLILGASVMGIIFSWGARTSAIEFAEPDAITNGMQLTFLVAAALIIIALWTVVQQTKKENQP